MNQRIALEESIADLAAASKAVMSAYQEAAAHMPYSDRQSVVGRIIASVLPLFHLTGEDLLHNHKYREQIMTTLYLNCLKKKGIHGVDHTGVPACEFKSMVLKTKKIKLNTPVAMLDKIDRKLNDPIYQNSAMMCALFLPSRADPVVFSFLIDAPDLRTLIAKRVPAASERFREQVERKGKAHDGLILTLADFTNMDSFRLIKNTDPVMVDDTVYVRLGLKRKAIV